MLSSPVGPRWYGPSDAGADARSRTRNSHHLRRRRGGCGRSPDPRSLDAARGGSGRTRGRDARPVPPVGQGLRGHRPRRPPVRPARVVELVGRRRGPGARPRRSGAVDQSPGRGRLDRELPAAQRRVVPGDDRVGRGEHALAGRVRLQPGEPAPRGARAPVDRRRRRVGVGRADGRLGARARADADRGRVVGVLGGVSGHRDREQRARSRLPARDRPGPGTARDGRSAADHARARCDVPVELAVGLVRQPGRLPRDPAARCSTPTCSPHRSASRSRCGRPPARPPRRRSRSSARPPGSSTSSRPTAGGSPGSACCSTRRCGSWSSSGCGSRSTGSDRASWAAAGPPRSCRSTTTAG